MTRNPALAYVPTSHSSKPSTSSAVATARTAHVVVRYQGSVYVLANVEGTGDPSGALVKVSE